MKIRIHYLQEWLILPIFFIFILSCSHGFSFANFSTIHSRPFEPKWESHVLSAKEKTNLKNVFNQPFYYLNSGQQSSAFISADGKFVMKFFKKERFQYNPPSFFIPKLFPWIKLKKIKKKQQIREKIFTAYKMSCDRLSNETGVLFVHFNATENLPHVYVTDQYGKTTFIPLDQYDFVIEKKATSLCQHLDELLKHHALSKAGEAVCNLLYLTRILYEKGFRNRDIEFVNNYGFIADQPVLFDVGRLLPCTHLEGPAKYQKKLASFFGAFRSWIQSFYPQLLSYCDAGIQYVIDCNSIDFSLCAFHTTRSAWPSPELNTTEKIRLEKALKQKYFFLNKGGQSLVFISEDKKYVIKFFKKRLFSIPNIKKTWLNFWKIKRLIKQRKAKQNRIFSAYQLGFDRMPRETGILYVHFDAVENLEDILHIRDSSGKKIDINLNHYDFIVEKTAIRLPDYLNPLIDQGEFIAAGHAIQSILQLIEKLFYNQMRNRDINIVNNYGFVDDMPVLFDLGRLVICKGKNDKKKFQKRLKRILPHFRTWIAHEYPMLLPFCNQEIHRICQSMNIKPI